MDQTSTPSSFNSLHLADHTTPSNGTTTCPNLPPFDFSSSTVPPPRIDSTAKPDQCDTTTPVSAENVPNSSSSDSNTTKPRLPSFKQDVFFLIIANEVYRQKGHTVPKRQVSSIWNKIFLAAKRTCFRKKSGAELWRTSRDLVPTDFFRCVMT